MIDTDLSATKAENRAGHTEIRNRRLTLEQRRAIRLAAVLGDDIRKNHPEIAEEYRSGLTAPKLVARHGFDRRYAMSQRAALDAVRNAIRGYSGLFHEPYHGLITDRSEREDLAYAHNQQAGAEE